LLGNKIGDVGAAALAKALPESNLTWLKCVRASRPFRHRHRALCCLLLLLLLLLLLMTRPPHAPCRWPHSLHANSFGGKCGTGWSSPSGAAGDLCEAWRAKHGSSAAFGSGKPMVMTVASN
jgi:hypothetical protein